jgi:nucleoside 2-deoxyribosyltransferase
MGAKEYVKPLKVYIAGPMFSSGDIDDNIREAIDVAYKVRMAGALPIVPHLFFFWDLMRPQSREFWLEMDEHFVRDADVLFRLSGISSGANDEVGWAHDEAIPVIYKLRELFDYIAKYNKGEIE